MSEFTAARVEDLAVAITGGFKGTFSFSPCLGISSLFYILCNVETHIHSYSNVVYLHAHTCSYSRRLGQNNQPKKQSITGNCAGNLNHQVVLLWNINTTHNVYSPVYSSRLTS